MAAAVHDFETVLSPNSPDAREGEQAAHRKRLARLSAGKCENEHGSILIDDVFQTNGSVLNGTRLPVCFFSDSEADAEFSKTQSN